MKLSGGQRQRIALARALAVEQLKQVRYFWKQAACKVPVCVMKQAASVRCTLPA